MQSKTLMICFWEMVCSYVMAETHKTPDRFLAFGMLKSLTEL